MLLRRIFEHFLKYSIEDFSLFVEPGGSFDFKAFDFDPSSALT